MTQIPPVISPNFREEIRNETYYLAAPTIRDEVVWRKIDGADTLVTRVSAEAETARPAEAESLLKPAFLTAVIQMTSNKFWMDAEGGWLGPIEYVEEFSQVKLAARVAAPPPQYAPFAQDFADALDNLKFMVDSVGTKGFVQKGVLDTVGGDRGFKIRHALFERRDDTRDNEEDEFPIKSWPVSSAHAKEGLEKIVDTHLVNLPAYDIDGNLIHPSEYSWQAPSSTSHSPSNTGRS
ncbi:hypothetical protein FB45DRAFT_1037032 [Roridomyces roridus]|uniref:Uncharacterized protein n=1 Tax=Roridomyces roridus TaxID=1738132 RepID=A0AAD7FD76_9AGAR|nr:hypothetical protein FB45DRAFT_1037032 [Roridomyces roridus]